MKQQKNDKVIPNVPLSWFVRLLLSRQPGLVTDKDEDLHNHATISADVAMILDTVDPNEEQIKILAPLQECNATKGYVLYRKSGYLKSLEHWKDLQRKQRARAAASHERDEKIHKVVEFLQKRYPESFEDTENAYDMAKTIVMQKNQAFLKALGIDIPLELLEDSVTVDCEIVDKQWYAEEAKRKEMMAKSEEF